MNKAELIKNLEALEMEALLYAAQEGDEYHEGAADAYRKALYFASKLER
jgi:hypothetical protein